MEQSVISYSLFGEDQNANGYYKVVEGLAKEIKGELLERFCNEIAQYQQFVQQQEIEHVRSKIEYGLEMLMLGVLWRCYSPAAKRLGRFQGYLLWWVAQTRKASKRAKPFWSKLKGKLGARYLAYNAQEETKEETCTLPEFIRWLKATGEYDEEAMRLEGWAYFFKSYSKKERENLKERLLHFTDEFCRKAEESLSSYIKGVEPFRRKNAKAYEKREDYIFCMQPVSLYVLNMVGAALLNEAYQKDFEQTKRCVIFLPGCMTYRQKAHCKAQPSHGGYICQGCSKECIVHRISDLAKIRGAKTVILYHESELNKQKVDDQQGKVGVIGVACVLNLISGGFKAKRLGYVPQCVLLDYCGCMQHWDEKGIVTTLSEEKLLTVLGQRNKEGGRYIKGTGK